MASSSVYITVRLDIENEKVNEITADDIQEVISEMDYEFKNSGDFQIVGTEICGINE